MSKKAAHPNLNENYFSQINTLEKAYWLGFLFAEGGITKPGKNQKRLVIDISNDDEWLISTFCEHIGDNKKKIRDYRNK